MVVFNIPHAVQADQTGRIMRGLFSCINGLKCIFCPACICPVEKSLEELLTERINDMD